jgi:hypothetical protein
MSQENVEIIRRGYGHFIATGEVRARADLVWHVPRLGWPDQQIYPGVDMRFAQVWTLRDGQAIRMQMYASPEEALEAVGLSE